MKRQVFSLATGLCLIYSAVLNASVCSNLIKTINNDINKSGSTIENKHLPWMNIYWLKKRLGSPIISRPEKSAPDNSAEEVTLEYTWHCPENEELRLSAIGNKKGLVTEINGQYSSEEGAEFFSVVLPQNKIMPPVAPKLPETKTQTPPAPIAKPVLKKVEPETPKPAAPEKVTQPPVKQQVKQETADPLAALLNPYNEYFQLSLKNKDQLVTDMTSKMKSFYKNLRNCTPGIYRYAIYLQSGFIFPVSTIEGKKKRLCKVGTVFTAPNVGEINAQCLYQAKNLAIYTDEEAESLIKGKSFDKAHPSIRDKVEAASCETYINGKLQPKLTE